MKYLCGKEAVDIAHRVILSIDTGSLAITLSMLERIG